LQAAQAQAEPKAFKKSLHLSNPKEFQNIFSKASKKNKTAATQAKKKYSTNDSNGQHKNDCNPRQTKRQPTTALTKNGRFSGSIKLCDSYKRDFVVAESLVLRKRQLLVAEERNGQPIRDLH